MGSVTTVVRQVVALAGALALVCAAAGLLAGPATLLWCAAAGAVALGFFALVTWRRHREVRRLAAEIDQVLHSGRAVSFATCREGDVEVLRSEVAKMVARLTRLTRQLEEEKASLADWMADISHQIRTPLTAIALTLSAVERASGEAERKELLRSLEAQVERVSWLVEALLKLAKLDAGALPMERGEVAVAELARRAACPLEVAMDLRDVALEVSCEGAPAFVGDLRWSAEALENVMKNCMEHTPPGGVVRIRGWEDALACRIEVSDSGPGIPASELGRVFERFYSGSARGEGFGIGLALARALVVAQGGALRAGNAPEGGARFSFAFPKMNV